MKRMWSRTVGVLGVLVILTVPAMGDEPGVARDVPFEPTHPDVVEAMLKLANVTDKDLVYDLGCGDGRIVIMAAKKFGARGFGVDIDPQRVKESKENAEAEGLTDRLSFIEGDIMKTDLSPATAVTMYLLNSVNLMVRPKLFRDLKPGTPIVSHAFHMADWESDKIVRHPKARNKMVYLWIMPAGVGGTWRWTDKTAQGETQYSLDLQQEFQAVRGFLASQGKEKVRVEDATLTGANLQFKATMPAGQKEAKVVYEGTVERDSIKGTQEWQGGPNAGKRPWQATRALVDLVGNWQIKVKSEIERLDGVLRIERDGKFLKASYTRNEDKQEMPISAFYTWGSSIRFELPPEGLPIVFIGSLDGKGGEGRAEKEGWATDLLWSAQRMK